MTTFSSLIASGKIESAYLTKQAVLVDIDKDLQMINTLDKENPSSRKFSRLEQSAEASVVELKAAGREFSKLLFKANPNIKSDDTYIAEDKREKELLMSLFDAIEKYIKLLNDKGVPYPPDVKPSLGHSDIASILDNQSKTMESFLKAQETKHESLVKTLVNSQNQNLKEIVTSQDKNLKEIVSSQDKSISRSSAPKASQPSFIAKGSDVDFANFAEFLKKFEFYVSSVANDAVRLQ